MSNRLAAWSWHHTGLVVDDLDTALAFYREAFGFGRRLTRCSVPDERPYTLSLVVGQAAFAFCNRSVVRARRAPSEEKR